MVQQLPTLALKKNPASRLHKKKKKCGKIKRYDMKQAYHKHSQFLHTTFTPPPSLQESRHSLMDIRWMLHRDLSLLTDIYSFGLFTQNMDRPPYCCCQTDKTDEGCQPWRD